MCRYAGHYLNNTNNTEGGGQLQDGWDKVNPTIGFVLFSLFLKSLIWDHNLFANGCKVQTIIIE